MIVTAFTQQKHDPAPMRLGVSTWRRAADVALPTRVKSSANYVGGRLARIEVRRLGYDDAIMLNDAGRSPRRPERVSWSLGCSHRHDADQRGLFGQHHARGSDHVVAELGLPLEQRPIERTELLSADECGLAGPFRS